MQVAAFVIPCKRQFVYGGYSESDKGPQETGQISWYCGNPVMQDNRYHGMCICMLFYISAERVRILVFAWCVVFSAVL
jgi:hypothetical protein